MVLGKLGQMSCLRLVITASFILLLLAPVGAQGLTAFDVANLRQAKGVLLSPDGHYLAYSVENPRLPSSLDFEDGLAKVEIYLLDLKTNKQRLFLGSSDEVKQLSWLPDSSGLAFLSTRKGDKKTSLYTIAVDGGEAICRLKFSENISYFSIAPDMQDVGFVAREPQPEQAKKREKLGFNREVFEEEWLYSKVYLSKLDANTSGLLPLPVQGHVSRIEFCPKKGDHRLLVVSAPNPGIDASLVYQSLSVIDYKGQTLAKVNHQGKLASAQWGPDGLGICFKAGVDKHDPDAGSLFWADSRTGQSKNLSADMPARVDEFSWRNSTEVIAAVSVGCDSKLMAFSISGERRELPYDPKLNYSEIVSLNDGPIVTVADSWNHPGEVFVNANKVTDLNPWLKERTLAKQEVVSYLARDGLELEGVLIHPLSSKGPAPTILVVHGGPESHVSDGWVTGYSTPGQLAAARGYSVFYPNYRGSTGRGVDFAKSSQGDPAGKEFDDLVDAVDHLVGLKVADKAKVGITGGSYGGYATAWCSTRYSDYFAAGVMFVGISDKVSKVGTTDIPDEEFLVHARKRPWQDWELFTSRSPIRYVEDAHTPLLIMHGKDDPRVHPTQSMELYRYLKLVGKTPVRLVLYPGEGHGNRKAAARYDYSLRMMQWFDTFLRGDTKDKPNPEIDYGL